jgi:DNA modification methylase
MERTRHTPDGQDIFADDSAPDIPHADKIDPALESFAVPIASLSFDPANARKHDRRNLDAIKGSLAMFGQVKPIVVRRDGMIVLAGNGTLEAAKELGWTRIAANIKDLDTATATAFAIADNRTAELAKWDEDTLGTLLGGLRDTQIDMEDLGFSEQEQVDLIGMVDAVPVEGNPDEVPAEQEREFSQRGEVFELGQHRLMCGDSTSPEDWYALMGSDKAALIHADPPYGMGKEADGVEGDNVYRENLDAFQMKWWKAVRPFVLDNASAYIWGNAPDLWRLWYQGGLAASEVLAIRNEIVWDKKAVPGMKSPGLTQYPEASERCLFIQIGNQFLGNINTDDFPETWEPVRGYFQAQADAAGIGPADIKTVCGCAMFSHWFTRSQYTLMPEKHYQAMGKAYPGHFERPWRDLKREWDTVKGGPLSEIQGARAYFDNAHDIMRDVWEFERVTGDERHGHATPKPVEMMKRCMLSSLPKGGVVIEPFAGSGSTLIGAAVTGRVCRTMEISPRFCDVVRRRWTKFAKENNMTVGTGGLE